MPLVVVMAIFLCIAFLIEWMETPTIRDHELIHRALDPQRSKPNLMPRKEIIRYTDMEVDTDNKLDFSSGEVKWYDDINYQQNALCGREKCFFRSLNDHLHGYLIGNPGQSTLSKAMSAYDYAAKLKSKYNIRHFYTSPPLEMKVPENFLKKLSDKYVSYYEGAQSVIVQPVITAPEGSIIARCYDDRVLLGRLQFILQSMTTESKENLLAELEDTMRIVQAEPILIKDFQLLVDQQGHIYHLDFDRAAFPNLKDALFFNGCLPAAIDFVKMHLSRLQPTARMIPWLTYNSTDWYVEAE